MHICISMLHMKHIVSITLTKDTLNRPIHWKNGHEKKFTSIAFFLVELCLCSVKYDQWISARMCACFFVSLFHFKICSPYHLLIQNEVDSRLSDVEQTQCKLKTKNKNQNTKIDSHTIYDSIQSASKCKIQIRTEQQLWTFWQALPLFSSFSHLIR